MANKTVYPFGTGGDLPSNIGLINDLKTGGVYDALTAEQGKVIGGILYTQSTYPSDDMTGFSSGKQFKADSSSVGKKLSQVTTTNTTGAMNYRIPVKDAYSITYRKFSSSHDYGCLFLDKDDIVISGVVSTSSSPNMRTVGIPEGAVTFIWSYIPGNVEDSSERVCTVEYLVTTKLSGRIDDADADIEELQVQAKKGPSAGVTGKAPAMQSGRIDSAGAKVANTAYVITDIIYGDFCLTLSEGWRVYEAHIYNRDGNLVAYQYIHPEVKFGPALGAWGDRKFLGIANSVPDYGLRLVFCKSDQSAIADGEQPVSNFISASDSGLHRWVPDDLPNYDRALRRVEQLVNLRFVPVAKVATAYPGSANAIADTYFFMAGRVGVGVPYSDVAETQKYVPNNVSIRTYLTAIKNKRSLLYTENLSSNNSKYGMSYQSGNRKAYYGAACDALTAYAMGLNTIYLSGKYHDNGIPGMSSVSYSSVDDLRPLDFMWKDGHICILTDIYKDDFGKVKLIGWAEMSTPYPYRTLYTPEQFNTRYTTQSYEVHRWNGWENLAEPEDTEFSQYILGQTRKEPKINEDIMCFAGDYAAFAEGDTIYLNARRNSVYTGVELYKDNVLLDTIDISELTADTIVTPNDEDWVAVNLTTLNLTYGKYKARLTDGENTTDYTYFEVIDVTFSVTKSGNTYTASFSSNSGTPVSLQRTQANGFPNSYIEITPAMAEAGQCTAWGAVSPYSYGVLLVKGDYGTVRKRISLP